MRLSCTRSQSTAQPNPFSAARTGLPLRASRVNLILYGPPGTGKTHWLRQKFAEYTDEPSQVDAATWLQRGA